MSMYGGYFAQRFAIDPSGYKRNAIWKLIGKTIYTKLEMEIKETDELKWEPTAYLQKYDGGCSCIKYKISLKMQKSETRRRWLKEIPWFKIKIEEGDLDTVDIASHVATGVGTIIPGGTGVGTIMEIETAAAGEILGPNVRPKIIGSGIDKKIIMEPDSYDIWIPTGEIMEEEISRKQVYSAAECPYKRWGIWESE